MHQSYNVFKCGYNVYDHFETRVVTVSSQFMKIFMEMRNLIIVISYYKVNEFEHVSFYIYIYIHTQWAHLLCLHDPQSVYTF